MAKKKSVKKTAIVAKPSKTYSDEMIKFIGKKLAEGATWDEIESDFNENYDFKTDKSKAALKWAYQEYKNCVFTEDEMVSNIKNVRRAQKTSRKLRVEKDAAIDALNTSEDLLEEIKHLIKSSKLQNIQIPKVSKDKSKTNLAVEMMVSDIHIGIKTETTNLDVTSRRLEEYTKVTLEEIERFKKNYNVTKIQLLLNGDIMQGNHLHGYDSAKSCEFSDAKQVAESIRVLFHKIIVPLAKTGIKVDVLGTCGNHDRQGKERPTVDAGEEYLTYTIYKTLEMLSEQSGLKNVSFDIPKKEYAVYEMFGHHFCVEHGHAPGVKNNAVSLEKQLLKRSNQAGKILKGIRIGHYHEPLVSGIGRHIVNGSTVSDDHFGDHLGYVSYPCQVLSYYVESDRDTSYYHSFQVNLGHII